MLFTAIPTLTFLEELPREIGKYQINTANSGNILQFVIWAFSKPVKVKLTLIKMTIGSDFFNTGIWRIKKLSKWKWIYPNWTSVRNNFKNSFIFLTLGFQIHIDIYQFCTIFLLWKCLSFRDFQNEIGPYCFFHFLKLLSIDSNFVSKLCIDWVTLIDPSGIMELYVGSSCTSVFPAMNAYFQFINVYGCPIQLLIF